MYRVGHLILRTLAMRASDPQYALARTSFNSPKSLPPLPLPPPPLNSNHFSHLLFVRLITGSFRGFFLLFTSFFFDYFGDSRNTFPHFFILYAISLRENTQWSESWESMENNSLETSSSTWLTKDYFFDEKFYLKTLNPRETQWKHLLYISSRFFIDECSWKPCSLRANLSVLLRSGLYFRCHIYLITDGSIVTSSITLCK